MGERAAQEFDDLRREHVFRPALPWREESRTECGREPDHWTITRDQLIDKVRKQGAARSKLTTCITCFETAQRWPDWNRSPAAVLAREIKNVSHWSGHQNNPINDELRAIALLIEAHRGEFDATLAALEATVPFAQRRRAHRQGRSL